MLGRYRYLRETYFWWKKNPENSQGVVQIHPRLRFARFYHHFSRVRQRLCDGKEEETKYLENCLKH